MVTVVSRGTPPPEVAARLFGDGLDLAQAFADRLTGEGVDRGFVGPREADRIWERHLLNCAVLGEVVPTGVAVIDVGSGAGLPGVPLTIARPDLRVTLVEPLLRRAEFLDDVVQDLGLADRVTVVRGRAEDVAGSVEAPVVTARALAPLERLARWCLPLVAPGGLIAALKGRSATEEVARDAAAVVALGGSSPEVVRCGVGIIDPPAHVVLVRR